MEAAKGIKVFQVNSLFKKCKIKGVAHSKIKGERRQHLQAK